ncbi:hypothetical protein BS78_04G083000 [Paspalum vaginatum]|nr:hypothetical protein BS78_04G083000 [Paspalum vaginatum]
MGAKMCVVLALLALFASATIATHIPTNIPSYFPPMMALGAMNPCMHYCMMQQLFTASTTRYMPTTMALGAMSPCMQYCMMQQVFTGGIQGQFPQIMAMGAINPCMQYCIAATRSLASQAMMLQQQLAFPLQQYLTPMMMSSMMSYPQCHCGAYSQVMQQPFIFNPMATTIPPMFFQQPIVGAAF